MVREYGKRPYMSRNMEYREYTDRATCQYMRYLGVQYRNMEFKKPYDNPNDDYREMIHYLYTGNEFSAADMVRGSLPVVTEAVPVPTPEPTPEPIPEGWYHYAVIVSNNIAYLYKQGTYVTAYPFEHGGIIAPGSAGDGVGDTWWDAYVLVPGAVWSGNFTPPTSAPVYDGTQLFMVNFDESGFVDEVAGLSPSTSYGATIDTSNKRFGISSAKLTASGAISYPYISVPDIFTYHLWNTIDIF